MSVFRNEELVKINGIQVSNNGFKNLAFETSRFSDGIETIRGFGSIMNERNLNIIDTISIDFFVDYSELSEFALVYSMFKAFGALPLENKYVLKKIKDTIKKKKIIKEFEESNENEKTISHLLVFLERMEIKSLERTNNAYSINLILSLYKNAFSEIEYEAFRDDFNEWDSETGFTNTCKSAIAEQISLLKSEGGITLKIMNIEKLNALYKNSALIQYTSTDSDETYTYENKEEKEEEATTRREALQKYEDLNKYTEIEIPAVNIGQIELITHNTIANIPVTGEPIGFKSYMGIGKTSFIAKMVFDESDEEQLSALKEMSDLNIISHKIQIETPLVNLFDFHSATVTNMFFNNIEEGNGVMVTIKFEINGYDYLNGNINSTLNLDEINTSTNNLYMTELYLEAVLNDLYDKRSTPSLENITKFFSQVVSGTTLNNYESGASAGTSSREALVTKLTMGDFLAGYISLVSSFGLGKLGDDNTTYKFPLSDADCNEYINKYINVQFDKTNSNASISKQFGGFFDMLENTDEKFNIKKISITNTAADSEERKKNISFSELLYSRQDLWNTTSFLKYLDLVGMVNIFSNDAYKTNIVKVFNNSVYKALNVDNIISIKDGRETSTAELKLVGGSSFFANDTVLATVNQLYNTKNAADTRPFLFAKSVYMNIMYDLFDITNGSLKPLLDELRKEDGIITTTGFNYEVVYNHIDKILSKLEEEVLSRLENTIFIDECIRITYLEVAKGDSYNQSFEGTKEYLEEYIETFKSELRNNITLKHRKIVDQAYGIFLSKTIYSLSMLTASQATYKTDNKEYVDPIDYTQLAKSFIISSSLMGLFMFKTSDRTDNFGYRLTSIAENIGGKLCNHFYLFKEYLKKYRSGSENITDKEVLKGYFTEALVSLSAVLDKVVTSVSEETESLTQNSIKKDHSFYYGKEIKVGDTEGIILDSLSNKDALEAQATLSEFIETKKKLFCEDEGYSTYIEEKFDYVDKRFVVPSFKTEFFTKKTTDDKIIINETMKKRIIGSNDPFMNLSKITELITNKDRELIPDYEIIVSQEEVEYENSGIYNNISLKNSLSLNNVSSVRIMKDPETKIKSAVITIVDFNKQLINVDDASTSISVKVDINGKVEYFIVEAGDKIKIRLGYAKEMKYAFNGYITAINSNGNIIEIICSSLASGLYSENIPELQLGPKSFLSKTANFVHSIFQSSERTEDAIKSKIYNPILYNDKTLNDHLLNITGENNNEVLKESELSSMYNVFLTLCATLSSTFKDKFLSKYSNNNSVIAQFMLEQLSKTFGKVDEQTNPNNKDTSIEFYQNIYNVDADYEVYGFVGDERTPQADTSEKTTDGFVRSPEKLVDGETKYTVDIEETQKASSIAGMEFGNWLFGSKKTNSSTLSTETTTTSETVEIVETTSDAKYIAPCSSRRITSKFGMRVHPVHKQSKFHNGIDIGPTIKGQVTDSDKIIATADGIVSFVKTSSSAGYYIAIEHADGVVSRYLHLKSNSALVKAGEKVKQGQVIAMMGATGQVNGPHLHFDLTIKGKKVDPVQYIEDGKVDWTYS